MLEGRLVSLKYPDPPKASRLPMASTGYGNSIPGLRKVLHETMQVFPTKQKNQKKQKKQRCSMKSHDAKKSMLRCAWSISSSIFVFFVFFGFCGEKLHIEILTQITHSRQADSSEGAQTLPCLPDISSTAPCYKPPIDRPVFTYFLQ